jgi:hypothetical protein
MLFWILQHLCGLTYHASLGDAGYTIERVNLFILTNLNELFLVL